MTLNFNDPEFARHYVEDDPGRFVPGYSVMQSMAVQLLKERAGDHGMILVVGAGGGLEILCMAGQQPQWTFHGVDPSSEMLAVGEALCCDIADRVVWTHGVVTDAPNGPFDGATCLLTLHFIPDDGGKLEALVAIRQRLRPGSTFVIVDLCLDQAAPDYDLMRDRYARFALSAGAGATDVADTREALVATLHTVSPRRNETLLAEAGFDDINLFYAGLSWRGWIATA